MLFLNTDKVKFCPDCADKLFYMMMYTESGEYDVAILVQHPNPLFIIHKLGLSIDPVGYHLMAPISSRMDPNEGNYVCNVDDTTLREVYDSYEFKPLEIICNCNEEAARMLNVLMDRPEIKIQMSQAAINGDMEDFLIPELICGVRTAIMLKVENGHFSTLEPDKADEDGCCVSTACDKSESYDCIKVNWDIFTEREMALIEEMEKREMEV